MTGEAGAGNYYSDLSAETSVSAAALVLTGLPPGPPGTASLPAAQPAVAGLAVTGEGGSAGPVVAAVLTPWHTLSASQSSLAEPLATPLHYGACSGQDIAVIMALSIVCIVIILNTHHPPRIVLVTFSTVITGFKRFLVTTRLKG